VIGTLAVAGSVITHHGGPEWLAPVALIAASVLGGLVHEAWAETDAPLPATVRRTFHVRTEALTLALTAIVLGGVRGLAPTLAPELVHIAALARLAFGIAAAFVVAHALITASVWFVEHELPGDLEACIQTPRRSPRLRPDHGPVRRTHHHSYYRPLRLTSTRFRKSIAFPSYRSARERKRERPTRSASKARKRTRRRSADTGHHRLSLPGHPWSA